MLKVSLFFFFKEQFSKTRLLKNIITRKKKRHNHISTTYIYIYIKSYKLKSNLNEANINVLIIPISNGIAFLLILFYFISLIFTFHLVHLNPYIEQFLYLCNVAVVEEPFDEASS